MRKLCAFAIAAALVATGASAVAAQEVVKPAPVINPLTGEVVKVIGGERIVVMKTADGKEVRLRVLPDARIMVNRKVVTLDDLAEGVPVRVVYTDRDGVYTVSSIESPVVAVPVQPGAAPPVVVPVKPVVVPVKPVVVPAEPAVIVAGGSVVGKVMEGDRPQPNLPVVLRTQDAKVIATTRTDLDGNFKFTNVAPGTYLAYSDKVDSQTKSEVPVTIKSGQTLNNVVLNLVRPPLP